MAMVEFDQSGQNPDNRVVNETHVINAIRPKETDDTISFTYQMFVPLKGPFSTYNLLVERKQADGTWLTLEYMKDYVFGHRSEALTMMYNKYWYGSIYLLDREYSGVVRVTYNSFGTGFQFDDSDIVALLQQRLVAPGATRLDSVIDLPSELPPWDHTHNATLDLTDGADFIAAIDRVTRALLDSSGNSGSGGSGGGGGTVGKDLSNVDNFRTATVEDTVAGTSSTLFTTPYGVSESIKKQLKDYCTKAEIDKRDQGISANFLAVTQSIAATTSLVNEQNSKFTKYDSRLEEQDKKITSFGESASNVDNLIKNYETIVSEQNTKISEASDSVDDLLKAMAKTYNSLYSLED